MTSMLAREKWQVGTMRVLERVFEERCRQTEIHGHAMRALPDFPGPHNHWLADTSTTLHLLNAREIQQVFRVEYEEASEEGRLTRMHLIREELAEAFECDPDSPEFIDEILQVAALCVQWAEYKIEEQAGG